MTDPDFLSIPPMTILETERLRLRTARVSDAKALLPVITDETTMKFTSGVVANDLEVAERWLSARVLGKDVLNFVITLKNNGDGVEKNDGEEGKEKEVIVGIMGSYHWPEVGYLMHPGKRSCLMVNRLRLPLGRALFRLSIVYCLLIILHIH